MTAETCHECDQPRPRDEEVADLYARLEALTAENERMRAVLTPSEENVEAVARVIEGIEDVGPWDDVAEAVLAALSERAGIK